MSKLYTEKEVRRILSFCDEMTMDACLADMTPIELPTDEEIEESANGYIVSKWEYAQDENKESFIEGAKWMRDRVGVN